MASCKYNNLISCTLFCVYLGVLACVDLDGFLFD